MTNPIVIGIDAGGTMTDTILVDQHGHFKIGKAATTPRNEAEGFLASAEDAAEAWGISLEELFSRRQRGALFRHRHAEHAAVAHRPPARASSPPRASRT